MIEKEPQCPLCHKKEIFIFAIAKDYQNVQDKTGYKAYKCSECNIVFQYPFPEKENFDQMYPEDYYAHTETGSIPLATRLLRSSLKGKDNFYFLFKYYRYPYLNEIKKSLKVLDIGCGKGLFLDAMKSNGKETYGLEPDENAVKILKKKGHHAIQGYISESNFDDNFFDLITMFQVFEHLENPSEVLREIYRILKPGGTLVFETPNVNSTPAKNKNFWRGLEFPRHLILHSPDSVKKLLEKENFKPKIATRISPFDIKETFILKNNIDDIWKKKLYSKLLLPYILLQYMFNHKKGSLLIAIAKKV